MSIFLLIVFCVLLLGFGIAIQRCCDLEEQLAELRETHKEEKGFHAQTFDKLMLSDKQLAAVIAERDANAKLVQELKDYIIRFENWEG